MRLLPALLLALAAAPAAAEVVVRPDFGLGGRGSQAEAASVPVGQTLRIVLPAQPGTGYSWQMQPPDPALLAPVRASCPAPPDARPGGVEPACFAFRALQLGSAGIAFVYRRPWETWDAGLSYRLSVSVVPPPPPEAMAPAPGGG
jgi:predicted secreted protein